MGRNGWHLSSSTHSRRPRKRTWMLCRATGCVDLLLSSTKKLSDAEPACTSSPRGRCTVSSTQSAVTMIRALQSLNKVRSRPTQASLTSLRIPHGTSPFRAGTSSKVLPLRGFLADRTIVRLPALISVSRGRFLFLSSGKRERVKNRSEKSPSTH